MSANSNPAADNARKAMVRQYELVCLASLLLLGLVLVPRHGAWTLLPMLVGVQAIYLRMRGGPVLFLLALQFELLDQWMAGWTPDHWLDLADVIQCAAVLGFVIGHYRLQGLMQSLLPGDPRQKAPEPSRRSVGPREIVALLLTLATWAMLVQFAWIALPRTGGELFRQPAGWRVLVLVWVIATAAILASGLLGYLRREHMNRDEAEMFFQDLLWHEYRGEQRRPNRWLAWARLRYERRRQRSLDSFPPSDV
jgi:hypothetical protein